MHCRLLALFAVTAAVEAAVDFSKYHHRVEMESVGNYDFALHWSVDFSSKDGTSSSGGMGGDAGTLRMAIAARTTGWLGVGFSESGGMLGSDMALGWVTPGTSGQDRPTNADLMQTMAATDDASGAPSATQRVWFSDRNTIGFTSHREPQIDAQQDWKLVSGTQIPSGDGGGVPVTVLEFERPINTCDEAGDLPIRRGTTRVIWAVSSTPPGAAGSPFPHHANMGVRTINMLEHRPDTAGIFPPPEAVTFSATVGNFNVKPVQTTYHCRAFELPSDKEYHIVAFEPEITAGSMGVVHHILNYECADLTEEDLKYSGDCYSGGNKEFNMPSVLQDCIGGKPVAAWAVGGGPFVYPENVGMPAGAKGTRYMIQEVHYDNPGLRADIIDDSGMRFYLTSPRSVSAGIMTMGIATNAIGLPPGQKALEVHSVSPPECTSHFPPGGVKVIATLLHAHKTGVGIRVDHVRDSKAIAPLAVNPNYDFNYQSFMEFAEPVVVLPGDSFYVTGTYDTTGRDSATVGGLDSDKEMLLAYSIFTPLGETDDDWANFFVSSPNIAALSPSLNPEFAKSVVGMCTNATACDEALEELAIVNLEGFFAKSTAGGLDWSTRAAADLWTSSVDSLGQFSFCLNDPKNGGENGKLKGTMEKAGIAPFKFESVCDGSQNPDSSSSSSSSSGSDSGSSDGKNGSGNGGNGGEKKKKSGHGGAIAVGVAVSLLLVAGVALMAVRYKSMQNKAAGSSHDAADPEQGNADYTALEE